MARTGLGLTGTPPKHYLLTTYFVGACLFVRFEQAGLLGAVCFCSFVGLKDLVPILVMLGLCMSGVVIKRAKSS